MRSDLAITISTSKMLTNDPFIVYRDGEKTRDFTYISDIVRVNLDPLKTNAADGNAMNVGGGHRITVNDLIGHLREITGSASEVVYSDKQKGDAEHTLAGVGLAGELVGYRPGVGIAEGLGRFVDWFKKPQHPSTL
ncbi:UDP-glucose 4-epimerase [Methanocalculus alkaliphilus]|nr:UDP-glucose 4-epimerase [Methanocalculus alkaliphilus]